MSRKLPKIITQEEFEQILKAEPKKVYKVAFTLGFEAGLRISEVVGYKDHIKPLDKSNIEGNIIRVVSGKGRKDRIVPKPKRINAAAISLLPITLDRRSLEYRIKKLGKKVLNKDITFHTLRHGFGSHLANKGMSLHQIQLLMGHENLATTGIYLHANPIETINRALDLF